MIWKLQVSLVSHFCFAICATQLHLICLFLSQPICFSQHELIFLSVCTFLWTLPFAYTLLSHNLSDPSCLGPTSWLLFINPFSFNSCYWHPDFFRTQARVHETLRNSSYLSTRTGHNFLATPYFTCVGPTCQWCDHLGLRELSLLVEMMLSKDSQN